MTLPIIKAVLNVCRINKARLFTKEGKEGKYLKIVLIPKKQLDPYGNECFMVKEDVSQQERQAGVEGNFIGDATVVKPRPKDASAAPAGAAPQQRAPRKW